VSHDSSDIDNTLIAMLGADSTLLSYMPDGIYWEEGPPNAKRFVVVSLVDEVDVQKFGARSYENALYMVKAVGLSTLSPNMKSAAARIDVLLDNGRVGLGSPPTVQGYTCMLLERESRLRRTEVDVVDPAIRWYHRGGNYRCYMSVSP